MTGMRVPLAALIAVLAASTGAHAQCPDWLMADMHARGVPDYEIRRMCGPPPTRSLGPPAGAAVAPAPPQRQSNRCVAETGATCSTATMRIVGSPCWCSLPGGGFAEGTIR